MKEGRKIEKVREREKDIAEEEEEEERSFYLNLFLCCPSFLCKS